MPTHFYKLWNHRIPVTVNNSDVLVENYYLLIEMDTATEITAGRMRADCQDILFSASDVATSYETHIRRLTENTATTQIAVKIPSLPNGNTVIYLYYGNSSANQGITEFDYNAVKIQGTDVALANPADQQVLAYNLTTKEYTPQSVVTLESDPVFGAWLLVPPNVSTFVNDAGYLTAEADPVFGAWLAIPPNVSTFTNDAGYLTPDVSLADGGTGASLADPGANALWGWDDTDNAIAFWTIGANLSYDHATHTLSATGGGGGAHNILSVTHTDTDTVPAPNNLDVLTWITADSKWKAQSPTGGGTPGGADTEIQYNDSGVFAGDADFTWDKTDKILAVGGSVAVEELSAEPALLAGFGKLYATTGTGIDSYTKLMLHFNGVDASTTFIDSSFFGHSVSAYGDVQLDTDQKEFGAASGLFDGTGDYLTSTNSEDWDFGTANFTIDAWIRISVAIGVNDVRRICAKGDIETNNGDWCFGFGHNVGWGAGTRINVAVRSGGIIDFTTDALAINVDTWYHIAFVRSGTGADEFKFYLDGVECGSFTSAHTFGGGSESLYVGSRKNPAAIIEYMNGWIDELRISKGIARWAAAFTPPIIEYSAKRLCYIDSDGNRYALAMNAV